MTEAMAPGERDMLAAELALGLLSGEARVEAETLRDTDPTFADEVTGWEERFAAFFAEIPVVAPSADLWPRIAARLADNDDAPIATGGGGRALPWKVATGLFGTVAAALALVLVTRPEPVAPPPVVVQAPAETLVAQLNAADGGSMLAARLDGERARLRIRATAIPDGTGEPELWVIPAGGAPTSLGLIARDGQTDVALTTEIRRLIVDGATLALTLEPREGAPHTAPKGDILGTARITQL